MSWNVLLTATALELDAIMEAAAGPLRKAGCTLKVAVSAGFPDPATLTPHLPEADAVLAGIEKYTSDVLASAGASRLKVVSRWGVGVDAVDLPAASREGVLVCNTPGLLDEAVADYAFGLLLALARNIHLGHLTMSGGKWSPVWGVDVNQATLGIVGLGRIGKALARRAAGFGMTILASDPNPQADAAALGVQMVSLDEVIARSDFISLHTALTPGTRGLINEERLKAMKPTARLINTSRGAVIDEAALVKALTEGWIAGAALDAFCVEPQPSNSPLLKAPNLLVTPHQASFGERTGKRVSETAAQAIIDAMNGRVPAHVVNRDVLDAPNKRWV